MLPWRRSTLQLIAEDSAKPGKPRGYAASLHRSALSSLARSCPEGALTRVGSMFRSRRKKVRITAEDPTYTVLYLGNATTLQAKGEGCTELAVCKIWGKSDMGKHGTKMKLTVSAQGIRMVHTEERAQRPGHLYLLHRVTFCATAGPRLPRVFAWIYRHEMKHKAVMLRCHAVLVSRPDKASAMALLLYQTSASALAEFRRLKRREDARHQQQLLSGEQGVPLLPLRRLLSAQCCYKPPAQRSRSAPKLGSITEDPQGEQEEQQGDLQGEEAGRALACECEDVLDTGEGGVRLLDTGEGGVRGGVRLLSQLISDLGEMSLGNDLHALTSDLRVTRLLSGESTGSESSIESNHESGEEGKGPDLV
ncbi:protein FAM43A [Ascaphus truei]|uniref:protein FAM43A n=1 Tax=Ascaphus truei TaxID=8439 RepID=UPI003F5AB79D